MTFLCCAEGEWVQFRGLRVKIVHAANGKVLLAVDHPKPRRPAAGQLSLFPASPRPRVAASLRPGATRAA